MGGVSYRDALCIILNINTIVTRSLQKLSTAQVSHTYMHSSMNMAKSFNLFAKKNHESIALLVLSH